MKKIICLLLVCFLSKNISASPWWILSYVNHTQNTSYVAPMGIGGITIPAIVGDSLSLTLQQDCWYVAIWRFNGDTISGSHLLTTLNTVVTQPGTFKAEGCNGWFYFYLSVPTGINPVQQTNFLNVFPTAVNSSITIQLNSIKTNDIEISFFDMNGRQLKNDFYKNVVGEFIKNENTEALAKGIYFIRIKAGEDTVEKKFVKM